MSSEANIHVNMDLCYSDTLSDFRGCFFNYQMNLYLSRGCDPDEYLKVFDVTDMGQIRSYLNKRHLFQKPEQALVFYRDFCKNAYFTEKQIRDFFAECLGFVRLIMDQQQDHEVKPFPRDVVVEILTDLANIVYRGDSSSKISTLMEEARVRLQDNYEPGHAYTALQNLFAQILSDWDVKTQYVGDDHGQRMKSIFCAESMGTQASANCALARGFYNFFTGLPDNEKFPRHRLSNSNFPRVNSYFWFVNNPFNMQSLEAEVVAASKVITKSSAGDFFKKFEYSKPEQTGETFQGGALQEQRTALVIALAAGKNFLLQNPAVDLFVPGPDDVKPFHDKNVGDWVHTMRMRAFAKDVDWDGRCFIRGDRRPGIYIDAISYQGLLEDEEIIGSSMPDPEEAYRQSILAMAPKHLQDVTVPGEVSPSPPLARPRKRKRVTISTDEGGKQVRKPFFREVQKDVDPKAEADNATIWYGVLGIGTFLGIMFLSRR